VLFLIETSPWKPLCQSFETLKVTVTLPRFAVTFGEPEGVGGGVAVGLGVGVGVGTGVGVGVGTGVGVGVAVGVGEGAGVGVAVGEGVGVGLAVVGVKTMFCAVTAEPPGEALKPMVIEPPFAPMRCDQLSGAST